MPGAFSTAWPPPGSQSTTRRSCLSVGSCLLTSSSRASRSRSRSNGVMSSVTNASVSSMRIFMRRIVLRSATPFGADPPRLLGRGLSRQQVMARAARHRESDAASRRAYVWADVATRFGGTSEGLARICRCSINVVLAEPGLADALWTRHAGCVRYGSSTVTTALLIGRRSYGGSKNGQANRAGAPVIRRRCRCRTPIRCRVQEAKLSSAS